ncbi:MAG: SpoIIE family protein phosphatase [Thermoleophilia bacterium]
MTAPPGAVPPQVHDTGRLAAVAATRLLDTAPESPFDDLARLAAEVLRAPLAFVTLVDGERSFWKACVGVGPGLRQNPVEESFCQYVIETPAPLLVGDTRLDPVTAANPSIEAMGVLAWAGVPLMSPDGHVLGSFCVVDTVPREWTEADERTLLALSRAAATEIALRAGLAAAETSRDRLKRLHALSERVNDATTKGRVSRTFLGEGLRAVGATGGSLRLVDASGSALEMVSSAGATGRFADRLGHAIPVSGAFACSQAFCARVPMVIADRDELAARLPETAGALDGLPVAAFSALPLLDRAENAMGVLTLSFDRPRSFDDAEMEFLEALATLCAQTLGRVELFEAERRSREGVERLQAVTAGLASAVTVADVAAVAAGAARRALGADRAELALPGGATAPPPGAGDEARFMETAAQVRAAGRGHGRDGAAAWLPLRRGATALGALRLGFDEERVFGARERALMATVADQLRDALERAGLHEATRRDHRRAAFVNAASARLDAATGVEARAQALADLLVPAIADFATVELPGPRRPRLAGLRHVDRGRAEALRRMRGRIPGPASPDPRGWPSPARELEIPLVIRDAPVGTLYLGNGPERGALGAEERRTAEEVASHAALCLENARLYEQEQHIARTLQRSLLPASLPRVDGLEIATSYLATGDANEVGGDFYDVFPVPGGTMAVVGDVCGKGPEAARLTAMCRHTVRAAALNGERDPAAIVALLNRSMLLGAGQLEFCTLALVRLEPRQDGAVWLECCVAGHPPPLVLRAGGRVDALTSRGGLVGVAADTPYGATTAALAPGDALVLHTDGLVEAGRRGTQFGEERLRRVLSGQAGSAAAEVVRALEDELHRHAGGADLRDDVAILAVRVRGEGVSRFRRQVPAHPAQLAGLRGGLRRWLDGRGLAPGAVDDLILAAGEACSNAVEHAYRRRPGDLHVTAWSDAGRVTVTVADRGAWDPSPARPDRGHGLALMRALSDDTEIAHGPSGTRVHLRAVRTGGAPAPPDPAADPGPQGAGTELRDGAVVVAGDIDLATAPGLRAALAAAREHWEVVMLDLSRTTYLDSAGLRVLFGLAAEFRDSGGGLEVIAPPGAHARQVLDVVGAGEVMRLHDARPAR